jgi:hypothetical protein
MNLMDFQTSCQANAEDQDLDINVTLSDAEGPSDQASERLISCVS